MLVCLTFDDGYVSHFERVGDSLREYGFGATFFLNGKCMMGVGWEGFLELRDFEIGNHMYRHQNFRSEGWFRRSVVKQQKWLNERGFGRARSFAYPGFHVDDIRVRAVEEFGFEVARGGPGWDCRAGGVGPVVDILRHSAWNVPCTFVMGARFGFRDFLESARILDRVVFTFHDFDDDELMSIRWGDFRQLLDYLTAAGCKVVGISEFWRLLNAG